jgi:hypothetical protein
LGDIIYPHLGEATTCFVANSAQSGDWSWWQVAMVASARSWWPLLAVGGKKRAQLQVQLIVGWAAGIAAN